MGKLLPERYPARRYITGQGLRGGSEIGSYLLLGSVKGAAFGCFLICLMMLGFAFAFFLLITGLFNCDVWARAVAGAVLMFFFLTCFIKTGHDFVPSDQRTKCATKLIFVAWGVCLCGLVYISASEAFNTTSKSKGEQISTENCGQSLPNKLSPAVIVPPSEWLYAYSGPAVPAYLEQWGSVATWRKLDFMHWLTVKDDYIWIRLTCINEDSVAHKFGYLEPFHNFDFFCDAMSSTPVHKEGTVPHVPQDFKPTLVKKSLPGQNHSALIIWENASIRLKGQKHNSVILLVGWVFFLLMTLYACCCNEPFQQNQLRGYLASTPPECYFQSDSTQCKNARNPHKSIVVV
eukprot:gb/GEZN01010491.1/.p1 GENE.gb/GEZN01010491.1/~~gb/GEZN01010491.1/.p1  ORF type:complete len:347 (-),score=25.92 gb/GEZN01010491.1/:144-1184(-)